MRKQLVIAPRAQRDFERRLPLVIRPKVLQSLLQLSADHDHPSLGTERYEGRKGLFECRIDDKYRMIVYPRDDTIHVLLADDHDRAYRRARKTRLPEGPIESVDADDLIAEPTAPVWGEQSALFAELDDHQLLAFGLDADFLPALRACRELEDIEKIDGLAADRADALLNYALYAAEGPVTRAQPESEEEVARLLDPRGRIGRIALDGAARGFLEAPIDGPQLVRGGAGAGKTALAVRIALKEARQGDLFADDERARVLFLCFNRSLARLIEDTCAVELGDRRGAVEVATIDDWCVAYLRERGLAPTLLQNADRDSILEEAVRAVSAGLDEKGRAFLREPLSFFVEEISQVILGRVDLGRDGYLRMDRVGRGRRLDRGQREIVWRLHETFAQLLEVHAAIDWARLGNLARRALEEDPDAPSYALVVVDEAQDLSPAKLRICTRLADGERVVFLADSAQNIYRPGFQWKDIKLKARICRLERNLRQSAPLHAFLRAVGGDLLDGEESDEDPVGHEPALKQGAPPSIVRCLDLGAEIDFAIDRVRRAIASGRDPGDIMLLASRTRLVKALGRRLRAAGLPAVDHADRDHPDFFDAARCKLLTIHSAKGLEAPVVVVLDVNEGSLPTEYRSDSLADREEQTRRQRRLLYVAASRATEELWITCTRPRASRFLEKLPEGLVREMRWPVGG